jgi:predicted RNA-binding Zn-ribbon protein involved in translation (DUF1610 family)
MTEYRVTWEIDIEAKSPLDAARKALIVQRDKDSIATVLKVSAWDTLHKGGPRDIIDLTEWGEKAVDYEADYNEHGADFCPNDGTELIETGEHNGRALFECSECGWKGIGTDDVHGDGITRTVRRA